MNIYIYLLDFI